MQWQAVFLQYNIGLIEVDIMKIKFCILFIVQAIFAGCKPENSTHSSAAREVPEAMPRKNEETAAARKLSEYIAEERIKEIQAVKSRIDQIQRRIDDANSEMLDEVDISRKLGYGSIGHIGNHSKSSEYRSARAALLADIQRSKERDEKALADAQLHLRSLLRRDDRPEK